MTRVRLTYVGLALLLVALTACDAFLSPQERIEHAQADIAAGNWGRADVLLRKVLQRNPHDAQAWLLLATLSLDAADPKGALDALERAAKSGASNNELDPIRARAWLATDEPRALIDSASRGALMLHEPVRTLYLARAYDELGEPDRALALLQPLVASHPRHIAALVATAHALVREGRLDAAQREIAVALAADPRAYAARLLEGEMLDARGDYAGAEKALETAIRDMPLSTPVSERGTALMKLAHVRLVRGSLAGAAQSEAQLAKLFPDSPQVDVLSARIKLARHDEIGGISDLERAIDRMPNLVPARLLLAEAQIARSDLEQARAQLIQVLQLAPANFAARKLLAEVYLDLGNPHDALHVLTPAIAEHAGDPLLYALLRQAGQRTGDSNVVIETLEQAVRAHPRERALRLDLASAYLAADRAPDALTILQATPDIAGDRRRNAMLVSALSAVRGPDAADQELDRILAVHPGDQQMLDLAAAYFASQKQFTRARDVLRRALAANDRDVPALATLARVDEAEGDAAGAESTLRAGLRVVAGNIALRLALADLLVHERAYAEADQLLEPEGYQRNPDLLFALARVQLARARPKQAEADLDRAITLERGRPEVVNAAGVLLLDARQYDAALVQFRRAASMAPDDAAYLLNAARAYLALNQLSAARQLLDRVNQLRPRWVPAISTLALIDLKEGNTHSALARAHDLLAARPHDPDALVFAGDTEFAVGRPQDAVAPYREALRRRPTGSVVIKLFQALSTSGCAHPSNPLERWLAREPDDTAVRDVLGQYYLTRHALGQAAREFSMVVAQAPGDVVALNDLAWTYMELGDPRAETLADRALKLAPRSASVEDTLGWILAREHAMGRALPLLTQAVKLDGTDPDIQYHYAYALAETGRRSEARAILTSALAKNRRFASQNDARRLLADLHD